MGGITEFRSSIFGLGGDSEKTKFTKFSPQLIWKLIFNIRFVGKRSHLLIHELPGHFPQLCEVLAQVCDLLEINSEFVPAKES